MSSPIRYLVIITVVILMCATVYTRIKRQDDSKATDISRFIESPHSDEPIDMNSLSMNIYETICEIGPPVSVKVGSLDPEKRNVFFKGTFKLKDSPGSQTTYPYIRMSLETIDAERSYNMEILDSLKDYDDDIESSDLSRFQIPLLRGVPDRLDVLKGLLGEHTVSHDRKSKGHQRLVYAKKMCINGQFVHGAYFDVDRDRIIKAKGLTSRENLTRALNDTWTPKPDPPDKEPKRYRDHLPEEGTAEYALIQFILLREAGKQDQAKLMLSDDQENEWLRDHITSQTEPGANIDLDDFVYQAVKRTNTKVEFKYMYRLDNGGLMDFGHTVIYEEGNWVIHH